MMDVLPRPGPYQLYKADSGAICFQVKLANDDSNAQFALTSKYGPQKDIYRFTLAPQCLLEDANKNALDERRGASFNLPQPLSTVFQEFWLTWYSGVICLGLEGQVEPFFEYADEDIGISNIGFIKFYTVSLPHWPVDWLFEAPLAIPSSNTQMFEDGKLRWARVLEGHLPADALIGGFEDEPIYIARAYHNGSVCPGKYVPSENLAYVPWGSREHAKRDFWILCGYNAAWVRTRGNRIPPNAFIAGSSEVRNEPLYVGRAIHDRKMLVGKIHVLYKTCYLPYRGREIEVYEFDILVSSDVVPRGVLPRRKVRI